MKGTNIVDKHSKHKKKRHSSPLEESEGEASGELEDGAPKFEDRKRSLSADSNSSPERVKKHKKKKKKHKRKHKQSDSEVEADSEPEFQAKYSKSPEIIEHHKTRRAQSKDRDTIDSVDRRRGNGEDNRRRERNRDEVPESYEFMRVKQEPMYEDNRARHYNISSSRRHTEGRHRERSEADYQTRRHHRRDEERPRYDRGENTSSGYRGHAHYHDERSFDSRPSYRERRQDEEQDRDAHAQSNRGRPGRGGRSQWRDEEEPRFNPTQAVKQERPSPPEGAGGEQTFEWGKKSDNVKKEKDAVPGEKEKPNFGLSGKLTEETNTFNGIVIKYSEPPEARKPRRRWRFYPFKGEKALQTLFIHRQSSYLLGRDRKIADIPIDHPSCSKQHAALQYRMVNFERDDGTAGKRVRPYIIDLESANGTFVNNKKIEARKYVELLEKDVVKFGFSSREYVLLHEHSKDDDYDDIGDTGGEVAPEETVGEPQNPSQE